MGYPMTWKRLLNRNALNDGDYGQPPRQWVQSGGSVAWQVVEGMPADKLAVAMRGTQAHREAEARHHNDRVAALAGDLRRLECDTLDEGYVCREIARRLDFDPGVVAAVLKEWMAV